VALLPWASVSKSAAARRHGCHERHPSCIDSHFLTFARRPSLILIAPIERLASVQRDKSEHLLGIARTSLTSPSISDTKVRTVPTLVNREAEEDRFPGVTLGAPASLGRTDRKGRRKSMTARCAP